MASDLEAKLGCRVLQGFMEACRLSFRCRRLVGSQLRMLESFLPRLLIFAAVRSQWLGVSSKSRQDTLRPRQSEGCGQHTQIPLFCLSALADAGVRSRVSNMHEEKQ